MAFHDAWLDSVLPWPWVAALVLLVACCFFYTRRVLLSYLCTTGLLLALLAFRYYSIWHQGLLFALLIFHTWLAWVSPHRRRLGPVPNAYWPALTTGVLLVTAAVHIWWSAMAGWNDWRYPYSGARAAARYMHEHGIDRQRVHVFKFSTIGILPYLDRNPFANVAPTMPGDFWVWSERNYIAQSAVGIVAESPKWVLVGAQLMPKDETDTPPPLPAYVPEAVFPGHMFWKDDYYQSDTYYLYRRVAPPFGHR